METVFIKIFNMSISAGWVILAVLLLRPLFAKAPKYIRCIMWAIAGLRLVFPFSIQSFFSLLPSAQTVPDDIMYSESPAIHSGINALNSAVNPVISASLASNPSYSANPMQIIVAVGAIVWVAGAVILLLYAAISYCLLKIKVREAIVYTDGIMLCDRIDSPFILGIFKPKIYLPACISGADSEYVTAHERAHIKRLDHIWKPVGFLLLCIYWFNPLIWAAYILLCKDIELACDEKVIKELGNDIKKSYSNALINLSVPKRFISACPLAFGEGAVKSRIRSVLCYKKPTLWIIIAATVCCVMLAICFLTDPIEEKENYGLSVTDSGSEYDGVAITIESASISEQDPYIELKIVNNADLGISYGEGYALYIDGKELTKDAVWHTLAYTLEPHSKETVMIPLSVYDITDGSYRLEKRFTVGRAEKEYTAFTEFEINRGFFTGKRYWGTHIVYQNGSFSSILYSEEDMPSFYVSDTDMTLRNSDGSVCGKLKKTELTEQSFDLLFTAEIWQDGYTPESIRQNNKNAFTCENQDGCIYFLLEQTDGNIYIATGHSSPRCIRYLIRLSDSAPTKLSGVMQNYYYHSSPEPLFAPTLSLDLTSNTFSFSWSLFSSYMAHGSVKRLDGCYELTTDDNLYIYYFNIEGENLVFDGKRSSAIPKYKYAADDTEAKCPVPDGAVFQTKKG